MIFNCEMEEVEFDSIIKRLSFRQSLNINSELCYKGQYIEELESSFYSAEQIFLAA